MKHPRWRVAAIDIIQRLAPDVLDNLQEQLETAVLLLPSKDLIVDFEVTGSYARRTAQLHSDLDMNLSTGSKEAVKENAQILQRHTNKFRDWHQSMRNIGQSLGIRFEFAFEHFAIKSLDFKQCFSLRQRKSFNTDTTRAYNDFWKLYPDGWKAKQKAQGRDYRRSATGDIAPDPWEDEIAEWAARYGQYYQHFGSTPDTAWGRDLMS